MVHDPFGSAGTTSFVSMQDARLSIIFDLNPDYAVMPRDCSDAACLASAAQMDVFHEAINLDIEVCILNRKNTYYVIGLLKCSLCFIRVYVDALQQVFYYIHRKR